MLRYLPALLAMAATTLLAHHLVDASFDRAKETEYKATVTRTEWLNPHVLVHANVTGPDGRPAEWTFELGSPGGMKREGWATEMLSQGTILTIRAFPAKDGSRKANVRRVTWPDGTTKEHVDGWMAADPNTILKGFVK